MVEQIIAIPSESNRGLSALGSIRFGRCPFFTIVKLAGKEIKEVKIVQNGTSDVMGGAGTATVHQLAAERVNAVIGCRYGPNAANALDMAGIKQYDQYSGNVKQIIDEFLKGNISLVKGPTSESHSGMHT